MLLAWMTSALLFGLTTAGPQAVQPSVEIRGHKIFVEVVRTPSEWQKGLMFREKLGPREGMLFWGKEERPQAFWMKNTLIPLDIIFISKNLKILNIHSHAKPHDESPLPSEGAALHVLEVNGGVANESGWKKGDRVKLENIDR